VVYFGGFKLGYFAGVGRISAAAIAGNIKLLSLGDLVRDYTGAYTVIFRGIFPYITSQKEQRSCNGRSAQRGWGAGAGTLFF
jgi:putative cofactor-binding repeat protein